MDRYLDHGTDNVHSNSDKMTKECYICKRTSVKEFKLTKKTILLCPLCAYEIMKQPLVENLSRELLLQVLEGLSIDNKSWYSEEEIRKKIDDYKQLALDTGGKDDYNHGLYNGMELIKSLLLGTEPELADKELFKK